MGSLLSPASGDWRTGGSVDRFHGQQVFEAFFAGSVRFAVVADAVGKVVRFIDELVWFSARAYFVDGAAEGSSMELQSVVKERRFNPQVPIRAVDAEIGAALFAVRRSTRCEQAGRKLHGEFNTLLDTGEARAGSFGSNLRGVRCRFFTGDPADGVQRIDAEIEQRPATGELAVEAPAGGVGAVESTLEALYLAEVP